MTTITIEPDGEGAPFDAVGTSRAAGQRHTQISGTTIAGLLRDDDQVLVPTETGAMFATLSDLVVDDTEVTFTAAGVAHTVSPVALVARRSDRRS